MDFTRHCTDGCCAANAASRGASHSEATEPLAEIVSAGRSAPVAHRLAGRAELAERRLHLALQAGALFRHHGAAGAVRARVSRVAPSVSSSPRI